MKIKVRMTSLIACMLFFVLFKVYFIPNEIRQGFKIVFLIALFVFLLRRLKKNEIFNVSLLYCGCMIVSATFNYLLGGYTFKAFLDSLLYALTLYDLYAFFLYGYKKGNGEHILKCLYGINFVYCALSLVSIILYGTDNNSNVSLYFFGNKFTTSYLFLCLIALYGATHDMKAKKNKCSLYIMCFATLLITGYIGCTTAFITMIVVLCFLLFKNLYCKLCLKPQVAVCSLCIAAFIPVTITKLLEIKFINNLIFNVFGKSYTVYGRIEVYTNYLFRLIKESFWLGHGYSSGVLLSETGIYSNAQNGVLDQFLNCGFLGVLAILLITFWCFKKTHVCENTIYLSIIVYAMIIASIFEVTINWFFWLGVCAIRWSFTAPVSTKKC